MPSKPLKSLNTLIVDNSHAVLNFASAVLKQDYGIENIQKTSSSISALELLRAEPPVDLLLLDLSMPEIDGLQFLSELSAINFQGFVVVLSGVAPQIIDAVEQAAKRYKLNYLGTLLKPISAHQFSTLLESVVAEQLTLEQESRSVSELKIYQLLGSLENEKLQLQYQPQIAFDTGLVDSFDVLVQLNQVSTQMMLPVKLLSKVAQNELLLNLASILLRRVFRDWSNWKKMGLELKLSLDIGVACLQKPEFISQLSELMLLFTIPAKKIRFYISHEELVNNGSEHKGWMGELQNKGFELALKDIDMGAVAQIDEWPVDLMVIEKASLAQTDNLLEPCAIAQSSIALAKRRGIVAVATSVNTLTEFELCKKLGCGAPHGLYASEPILAKDVLARMAN